MTQSPLRLGVDLGGTKIEVMALSRQGEEIWRERTPTPQESAEGIVETIAQLVERAERDLNQRGSVGIGTPGAISAQTGLIKNSNTLCLNGFPLKERLEKRLARPIPLANDANCFALSEAVDGAGRGGRLIFGVILGTGVGGAVVMDQQIWPGRNAIAGEWGHNPLPWPTDAERPGPPCYCGRSGCIETFLSGPGLAADHVLHTGQSLDGVDIDQAAQKGDADALASLARHAERLARSLAHVINVLDPDVIVLGGGLSNLNGLVDAVQARWAPWVFSDRVDTLLVRHVHGDSSGVRGAAWLGAGA
jgi:predicted NBD/HSP70 family sugar kinase